PVRVPGYQPRWLDEAIAGGEWVWTCEADPGTGPGNLAFWRRENLVQVPPPPETTQLDTEMGQVLQRLRERGACFLVDLAQDTGLAPSVVRLALGKLQRCRLVTNDHFDVIRRGEQVPSRPAEQQTGRPLIPAHGRRAARPRPTPEGRWSLLGW